MMFGVKSVLEHEDDEPVEVNIPRDSEAQILGRDRYEVDEKLLQPMRGKDNLIEPVDVYQVLFKNNIQPEDFQPVERWT
jgi:hypothetical protein